MKVFQTASDKFVGSVILYKGDNDKLYKNKELTKEITDEELLELFKTNNVLINENGENDYTLKKIISVTVNDDGTVTYSTSSGGGSSEDMLEEQTVSYELYAEPGYRTESSPYYWSMKPKNSEQNFYIRGFENYFKEDLRITGYANIYLGDMVDQSILIDEKVKYDGEKYYIGGLNGEDYYITIDGSSQIFYINSDYISGLGQTIQLYLSFSTQGLKNELTNASCTKDLDLLYLLFDELVNVRNKIHFDVELRDGSAPIINSDVTFEQLTSMFNDSNHDINSYITFKNLLGEKSRFLGDKITFHESYDPSVLSYFSIESYSLDRDRQDIISCIFELEIYANDTIELYMYDNYKGGPQPS